MPTNTDGYVAPSKGTLADAVTYSTTPVAKTSDQFSLAGVMADDCRTGRVTTVIKPRTSGQCMRVGARSLPPFIHWLIHLNR